MRFRLETWDIARLVQTHEDNHLNLNPPYQRKFIWSLDDQRILIESIEKNYPIPNIFLKENAPGDFEVVDGQQRTRTIIGFKGGLFTDNDGRSYSVEAFPDFNHFLLSIIIIEEISEDDLSIEQFYSLVNSAGEHLNRPELKKAEFYDSKFLELINLCNDYEPFKNLGLFTDAVLKRMSDMDFVSELIVQLRSGITDKKETVDRTFEADISQEEFDNLRDRFLNIINQLSRLNNLYPIKRTRYKQKNDFYTLFGFFDTNIVSDEYLNAVYETLVLVGSDITPSNDECLPFQTYARNCVTQSNSKAARLERLVFFNSLFLNDTSTMNSVQRDVIRYYEINEAEATPISGYFLINISHLQEVKPSIVFNNAQNGTSI